MVSVIRGGRFLSVVIAALVVLSAAVPATAQKKKGDVHRPPYKRGPSGGDEWNYAHADPETGQVTVLRVFPGFSPVVGCAPEPSAGWAMLKVKHAVHDPVRSVTVNFEGGLDPYAWATAAVRGAGGSWLGVEKLQGPHMGAGKLKIRLNRRPDLHSDINIEFGVQLGDACPQVGGGDLTFPSIRVN